MIKRFKYRKKRRNKAPIIIMLIILLGVILLVLKVTSKMSLEPLNIDLLNRLIYESNHNITYNYDRHKIVTKMIRFFSNVSLDNPTSIINRNYLGLVSCDPDNSIDLADARGMSEYLIDPYEEIDPEKPLVYIYNTHQLENYTSSNLAEYNVKPNVMLASYILREKLNDLNIPSVVEEGNITEVLQTNGWNYASSYRVSKMMMESAKEKYPSIKYFVDVHRDSATKNITYANLNGKEYAKILFIVGLENPDYEKNLKITARINEMLEEEVPGITRGIYKKQGPGVDGVYNQDISPNAILVEMGGVDNKIEEVLNSTEVLAKVLYKYIGEENERS